MKQTKADKFRDIANAVKQIRDGKPVRRIGAIDGSIATHPVIEVDRDKPEAVVLSECLSWLRKKRIFCNRHDCGAGNFGNGYATYGIRGAGDIIGIMPNGKHFEIEVKKGKGGRLSKEQQKRSKDVRATNGLYFVVHGVEELEYCMGGLL